MKSQFKMHDLNFFRNNLDSVAARLATRGFTFDLDRFRALDVERRAAITESEQLTAAKKKESAEIGKLRQHGQDTSLLQQKTREKDDRIRELGERAAALEQEFRDLLERIPNTPHESIPQGSGPEDNLTVHSVGTPREFDFEPKAHWDLGPSLGILDLERAAKVTGARFAVYIDQGARLERALINFMLDVHTREHGYTEVLPPFLINSASLFGTGQLPKFAADLFKIEGTDFWLAPTAEVPVTNLFRDETLDPGKLPISLCAYTPCFRSEAGAHGRDVRGIIRQHQFQKVELVKFTTPDQSHDELERLTTDAEDILNRLELPFRRVVLCTGDIGFSSAKTYDLEVWLPSQREFKEISSCSNFEAFQARRANIRFRSGKRSEHAHTLNGSGLAAGRTWVAIVENYQQKDGSILIPEALRPFVGAEIITARGLLR
jgi:seryl-tRNA synthetase